MRFVRRCALAALRGAPKRERGTAIAEFAFVLPWMLVLMVLTIDFGHLIQTRLVITNLSREGGSVVSREPAVGNDILTMLQVSGYPLDFRGADGRIVITRFAAGESLRWTCTYDNRNDRDFEFGPFTDSNEHCNLFAFYYPTQSLNESTTCVLEDGVATTTVRGGS